MWYLTTIMTMWMSMKVVLALMLAYSDVVNDVPLGLRIPFRTQVMALALVMMVLAVHPDSRQVSALLWV
jgi:hypothetical protein